MVVEVMPDAAAGRQDAPVEEDEIGIEGLSVEQALIVELAGAGVDGFGDAESSGVGVGDALGKGLAGGEGEEDKEEKSNGAHGLILGEVIVKRSVGVEEDFGFLDGGEGTMGFADSGVVEDAGSPEAGGRFEFAFEDKDGVSAGGVEVAGFGELDDGGHEVVGVVVMEEALGEPGRGAGRLDGFPGDAGRVEGEGAGRGSGKEGECKEEGKGAHGDSFITGVGVEGRANKIRKWSPHLPSPHRTPGAWASSSGCG
jgi:hypothetical protein